MLFDVNENVSRGPLVVTFAESFSAKAFTNKIIMLMRLVDSPERGMTATEKILVELKFAGLLRTRR